MNSHQEQPRRRESRSGTRKVSSLSAEQLERKRSNDREAQRSIRERTKDHIKKLEAQVGEYKLEIAELRRQTEQFDKVMQRNAILEEELSMLRRQIASLTGRPEFVPENEQMDSFRSGWPMEDAQNTISPGMPTTGSLLSPQFTAASNPRTPSGLSASSRASHQQEWQHHHTSTRSPSLSASSNPEYHSRMESYVMDAQLQGQRMCPPSIPASHAHVGFGGATSPRQQSDSFFPQFPYAGRPIAHVSPIPPAPLSEVYPHSASAYQQQTYGCKWPQS